MDPATSPFVVKIDFDQSHLFFPNIIHWILAILLIATAVAYGPGLIRDIRSGKHRPWPARGEFNAVHFFGTIALMVVYFALLEPVGSNFPNTGLGFLIVSMPFMFLVSLLYVPGLTVRRFVIIGFNSVLSPVMVWLLLAYYLNITLP